MLSLWELLAIVLAGLAALAVAIRHLLAPRPIPGIPHLPITSLLGDIPKLGETLKRHNAVRRPFFEKYAAELGPIYQALIGPKSMVILSDPYEIEDVLLRSRSKFVDVTLTTGDIFGGIIPYAQVSLLTNELWKKHRRVSGPSMSATFLKQSSPRIANNAIALLAYWRDKMSAIRTRGGRSFDCTADISICTSDMMAELVFGENAGGISGIQSAINDITANAVVGDHGGTTFPACEWTALHQAVSHHMAALATGAGVPPMLVKLYWFYTTHTKAFRTHDAFIKNLIRSRIAEARVRAANVEATGRSEMADCIIDMIIEKEHKGSDKQSEQELLDELIGFVFAGHDTTAAAAAFSLKLLTNHPEVQKKLYRELTSNLMEPKDRVLTYEDVGTSDKTPYLEAVVHEVLRCADITITSRQALEDITILGKHVPKGTEILFLTGMAGRNATASYFARRQEIIAGDFKPTKGMWADDDVNDFNPERWLVNGPNGNKIFLASQGYSFPFGLGTRACFGIKLALLELRVIIATINLGAFLDVIPDALNSFEGYEEITLKPKQAYISLVDWEDVKDS